MQADGRKDMTRLTVAFSNYANALKITCVFNMFAPSCLESSSLHATWSSKAEVGKELGAEGVFSNAKTQC